MDIEKIRQKFFQKGLISLNITIKQNQGNFSANWAKLNFFYKKLDKFILNWFNNIVIIELSIIIPIENPCLLPLSQDSTFFVFIFD
jgi:hypothetical protein